MNFKILLSTAVAAIVLGSGLAQSEPFKIKLTEFDQAKLTKNLSKIDLQYRHEEVVQETPFQIIKRSYNFLNDSNAFYISCSEQFMNSSTVGSKQKCDIGFDYGLSQQNALEVHDGFMPDFAIAEIKNSQIAQVLYKTIGNGISPSVSFNSNEQLVITHPTTGKKFPAFKLRMDCQRDEHWSKFSCVASAVK